MKDQITLNRIQLMHPKLRAEVLEMYNQICLALTGKAICRFSYTLRTYKEQDDLYALGRTKPGKIVTHARGGQSYHNFGLAFDIVLLIDEKGNGKFNKASWQTNVDFDGDGIHDWFEVVRICKLYGWEWGGDWKFSDKPHFQKTLGHSVVKLAALVKAGRVDAKTKTYPKV